MRDGEELPALAGRDLGVRERATEERTKHFSHLSGREMEAVELLSFLLGNRVCFGKEPFDEDQESPLCMSHGHWNGHPHGRVKRNRAALERTQPDSPERASPYFLSPVPWVSLPP
jgi:hypothetical protein